MEKKRETIDKIGGLIKSLAAARIQTGLAVTIEFLEDAKFFQEIYEKLNKILEIYGEVGLSESDFSPLFKLAMNEYRCNNAVEMESSISLEANKSGTWLTEERIAKTIWNYRDRYERLLRSSGRASRYVDETMASSMKILKKLGNPVSDKDFYVKGLVVGSVQSGKTGNFNAVINGAIDLGYTLIVVLSGITEDLRSQTQVRIESDVVGEGIVDSSKGRRDSKGVGKVRKFGELGDSRVPQIVIPTSAKTDFKRTIKEADFSLNQKNILVCKKNPSVLRNLILWLDENLSGSAKGQSGISFLLVDDEADNASLNNLGYKGIEFATTINALIRVLLGLFRRKSYIGYTATPFANVLQDRNEAPRKRYSIPTKVDNNVIPKEFDLESSLSADDFIELLFPPSNYIGAKQLFETRIGQYKKLYPLVAPPVLDHQSAFPGRVSKMTGQPVSADDSETRCVQATDNFPDHLPDSLMDAIKCFVLAIALKTSRKPLMADSPLWQPHNSMLIHVSRYKLWQVKTCELVKRYVAGLLTRLENDLPNHPESIYAEFQRIWYKYYAYVVDNIKSLVAGDYEDSFLVPRKFDEIKPLLVSSISGIEVVAVNSMTNSKLKYDESVDRKYIAIGGDRLSRGFTLEGLTVNYFVRTTNLADALFQMGRWFGYRPGYLDCCKLFTTQENIEKFDQVSITIEELEQVFVDLNRRNAKPKDFEVLVQNNPKVIRLTRDTILKNTISRKVSFSGRVEQSAVLLMDGNRISAAWNSLVEHISGLTWTAEEREGFFLHKTTASGLLEFLNLPNVFCDFENPNVQMYVRACENLGKLTNWTIGIKRNTLGRSAKGRELLPSTTGLPGNVRLSERSGPTSNNTRLWESLINERRFMVSGASAQLVASGSDYSLTLSEDEIEVAEISFYDRKAGEIAKRDNISLAEAMVKAKQIKSIPESVYRAQMDERDGVLLIYLLDCESIFEPKGANAEDRKLLEQYMTQNKIDPKLPIVGYAIGFPFISGEIGADYVAFPVDEERYSSDEPDDSDEEELSDLAAEFSS